MIKGDGRINEKYLNKIVLGDSMEILKDIEDNSVDAVITDPPYSSGGQTAGDRKRSPSEKYEQGDNKIVHRMDFVGDTMDQRSWIHWCTLYNCAGGGWTKTDIAVLVVEARHASQFIFPFFPVPFDAIPCRHLRHELS